MKPYSSDLYKAISGRKRNTSVNLVTDAPGAMRCIQMWRSFLCLLVTNGGDFQRPISSFSTDAPSIVLEYDASLTGIGVIIFNVVEGAEVEWFVIQEVFPFDLGGDSGFQNSVEFIAITIGVTALAARGVRNVNIHVRGDSKASLKWSGSDSFRSRRCRAAATCFIAITTYSGISIVSVEHIPGETNVRCDALSRCKENGLSPADLGFSDTSVFQLSANPYVQALLKLCEPRDVTADECDKDFMGYWTEALVLTKRIVI
jgi:hypothetical protein